MNSPQNKTYLLPGQLTIVVGDEVVWTLLGSCIAIILHHPQTRQSAVCHAQLPSPSAHVSCTDTCPHPCGKSEKADFKYVTCAFKYMWNHFQQQQICGHELEVSVFGGAGIFNSLGSSMRVGAMNIRTALDVLASHRLSIHTQDIGGTSARKLLHHSATGYTELFTTATGHQ